MDCLDDPITKQFTDLLAVFDLKQHVVGATHKHGHTIDYILTRKADNIVHPLQTLHRAISDHHAISCILSCDTQSEKANPTSRRMFRRLDPIAFAEDMETSLNQINKDSLSLCMEDVALCIKTCLDIFMLRFS